MHHDVRTLLTLFLCAGALASSSPVRAVQTAPPAEAAAANPRLKVAVPDMLAGDLDAELARNLTEVVTAEATRTPGLDVIGMADIQAMLGLETQKQLLGCDEASCMAEIGGALGVDVLLSSRVGKVGETYVLSVRAFDTRAARVLSSALENVEGKPDALIPAARRATRQALAGLARDDGTGVLRGVEPWPAWALVGLGSTAAVVGLGLGAAALYNARFDLQQVWLEDLEYQYIPVGGQQGFIWARGLGISALATLGGGLLGIAGGVAWLLLADAAE